MSDAYTRFVLTVIAIALVSIAVRMGSPVPPAHATETMECRFGGAMEISRIGSEISVEVKEVYGQPGSSSGHPLYVRMVD